MTSDASISIGSTQESGTRRDLLYAAWAIVLLTAVPEIILRAFLQLDTSWMLPARVGLLAMLLGLTFVWPLIRPLRGFVLAMLVIYAVEGWFFLTLIPQSKAYQDVFGGSMNLLFFGERLLRIGASLVMLLVLLAMGLKRRDFYLALGNLKAEAEPSVIPRKSESWTKFGRNYALISVGILLIFMVPALQPSLENFSIGLLLFAMICAALNAFAEEFLYRSALLPQVLPLFGKSATLLLIPAWFGLGHYFGVPSGLTGVLITAIGGWFFAKSMIETRGMGWAWFLHFLADFTVYMVLLLAGGL
jgi:membrane protease YdiL (CAAX protease family)